MRAKQTRLYLVSAILLQAGLSSFYYLGERAYRDDEAGDREVRQRCRRWISHSERLIRWLLDTEKSWRQDLESRSSTDAPLWIDAEQIGDQLVLEWVPALQRTAATLQNELGYPSPNMMDYYLYCRGTAALLLRFEGILCDAPEKDSAAITSCCDEGRSMWKPLLDILENEIVQIEDDELLESWRRNSLREGASSFVRQTTELTVNLTVEHVGNGT